MAKFFHTTGWELTSETSGVKQIWTLPQTRAALMLPLDTSFADFTLRMSEVLKGLSDITGLSGEPLALEVARASHDILLVRADQYARNGSIPIREANRLLSNTTDMIEAAAASALRPRASVRGRKAQQVYDFMNDDVRMGHTMRGSFVITILAELEPPEDSDGHKFKTPEEDPKDAIPPFSRTAFSHLARGLSSSIALAAGDSNLDLDAAVTSGVTAELLESLEQMGEYEELRGLDLRFKWSPSVETGRPPESANRTRISRETINKFDPVIDTLRRKSASSPRQIVGYVTKLVRSPSDTEGTVVIEGTFDVPEVKARVLHVSLSGGQYTWAVKAHERTTPVVVDGVFEKVGRTYRSQGAVVLREALGGS